MSTSTAVRKDQVLVEAERIGVTATVQPSVPRLDSVQFGEVYVITVDGRDSGRMGFRAAMSYLRGVSAAA